MDIRVLVRALVFDQVVDIHTNFAGLRFRVIDPDHDTRGINIIHHTTTCCCHNRA